MAGEAVQRKLAPGFDICFQAQGKRVRLGRFDAVDATLLALLSAYKARAG